MVSVAYIPSTRGRPSTASRIQVAPSTGSLVGVGCGMAMAVGVCTLTGGCSGTAVPTASSGGATGCGPLQATRTMNATTNIGMVAWSVARAILILSSLGKQFPFGVIVRLGGQIMRHCVSENPIEKLASCSGLVDVPVWL